MSILSKVGVYAVLRLWLLLFGDEAGDAAGFGGTWLTVGGLLTIAFGSAAVLATQDMARLAGASVLVSSGTLLAAIGMGEVAVTGGALFYVASSVPAIAAFFLLIELVQERGREVGADVLAVTREAFGEDEHPDDDDDGGGRRCPSRPPWRSSDSASSVARCCWRGSRRSRVSSPSSPCSRPLFNSGGEGGVAATAWTLLAALVLSGLATVGAIVLGLDTLYVNAAMLLLVFGMRTGSTALLRGGAGDRPARLRLRGGVGQVPHARRGDRMRAHVEAVPAWLRCRSRCSCWPAPGWR